MATGWNDKRPLSPHLSIWKWHPTMLSSILHRASGIFLYFGLLKLCLFLGFLAAGPEAFKKFEPVLYSPLGFAVFFVVSGVLVFHLLNGVRHLIWDAGKGFDPKVANVISILIIIAAFISALALSAVLAGSMQ